MDNLSEVQLRAAVSSSYSTAGVIRALGRALVGTNYRLVKRELARLGLDTSHWKGGSPPTQQRKPQQRLCSKEVLVPNNSRPRALVRRVLLRENLVPYTCAECGLGPEWNGKSLVLRLDHKNGIRNDDRLENLRFMCPNCDAQSETFCGRNLSTRGQGERSDKKRPCGICRKNLTFMRRCRSCAAADRHKIEPQPTKIAWPPVEELQTRLANSSFVALASELGVSDNAIRKHLRSHARVAEGGGF
jgi:hypothetical protein